MDPNKAAAVLRERGLPRTRGDGPFRSVGTMAGSRASPHTRGWTSGRSAMHSAGCGFPAHAGMDPSRPASRRRSVGLPRTRGDGPPTLTLCMIVTTASPHTRGWTRAEQPVEQGLRGFPAHAGMDLSPYWDTAYREGLPRTRGDGPWSGNGRRSVSKASPHTRGWTRPTRCRTARRGGFPAHAGMDPGSGGQGCAQERLPRTRGDGPVMATAVRSGGMASPHTRG